MRSRDLLKAIPLLMTPSLARADTLPLRHPERKSHIARPYMDHRLGGPGARLSGARYALRDRREQQGPASGSCAGTNVSADELTWTLSSERRARLPRRRKSPGEGLRDVAEALGLA